MECKAIYIQNLDFDAVSRKREKEKEKEKEKNEGSRIADEVHSICFRLTQGISSLPRNSRR